MSRRVLCAVFFLVSVSTCFAQAPATPPQAGAQAAAGSQSGATSGDSAAIRGVFPLAPTKGLDSKKLKDGDSIVCTTTAVVHLGNGTMIPSGSKVVGHITVAKARSKGDSDSSLGFVFDKIQMANGKDILMKGTLLAVAPDPGGHSGPDTGAAGPGNLPGHGDTTTVPPASDTAVAGPNSGVHTLSTVTSHVLLTSQSRGVLGFPNMQMDKDGVLSTNGKELKLGSGTQMLILAEIPIPPM